MIKRYVIFLMFLVAMALTSLPVIAADTSSISTGTTGTLATAGTGTQISSKAADLRLSMRDLWTDHMLWVRSVAYSTIYNDNAAMRVAEDKIVQNARDISNAIVPYYGEEAADKLFNLHAGHYGAVKEYLTASLANDQSAKDAAVERLKSNANEIATFLNAINPSGWPKDTVLSLAMPHGQDHISEIDALVVKDYDREASITRTMKDHVYQIADAMASGIQVQFPQKF